jgi:hypothetical protein
LENERPMILSDAHEAVAGGHYAGKVMAHNILCMVRWWPTLHKDAKEFFQTCDVCQRVEKPSRRDAIPLVLQVTLHTFEKWEFYLVGPIKPPTNRSETRYIITVIDHLTDGMKQNLSEIATQKLLGFFFFRMLLQGLDV